MAYDANADLAILSQAWGILGIGSTLCKSYLGSRIWLGWLQGRGGGAAKHGQPCLIAHMTAIHPYARPRQI